MTYTIISTSPAARGKTYYSVMISDTKTRQYKLDPNLTQEQVDVYVDQELELEQRLRDDRAKFEQLIADGIIEDPSKVQE
tara:strand:+ start:2850 stop:3089 length:240 start_codon:yes stop_codon:yes gene_type:complete